MREDRNELVYPDKKKRRAGDFLRKVRKEAAALRTTIRSDGKRFTVMS